MVKKNSRQRKYQDEKAHRVAYTILYDAVDLLGTFVRKRMGGQHAGGQRSVRCLLGDLERDIRFMRRALEPDKESGR